MTVYRKISELSVDGAVGGNEWIPTLDAGANVVLTPNMLKPWILSSAVLTGVPTTPTPSTADDSTKVASTAYVKANLLGKADLAGAVFTGPISVASSITANGNISSGFAFQSSVAVVALAPTGAGQIYLRPNGAGSGTGQVIIDSTGEMVVNGKLTVTGNLAYVLNVQAVVSAATVTPVAANELVKVTAQAAAIQFLNPTGAYQEGQGFAIRLKDNGTPRAITWDTNYRALGVVLPTTTVAGKTLYIGIIYNANDAKWDVISLAQQA